MGYIRDNEDWYYAMGYSASEAKIRAKLDQRNLDYGFCNPIKAKLAAEEEDEVRKELAEDTP